MHKLNNIKEAGFLEIYKDWAQYGPGVMLVYQSPPKGDSKKHTCEYVMFREFEGFRKVVINQDLLDFYNKGNE